MRVLLVILCLLVGPALARADQRPFDRARAQELYRQGKTHYELAEYAAAITAFKECYALTEEPELLYDIAQSYRLSEDCGLALRFYESYLRAAPDGRLHDKAAARRDEMKACVARASEPPPADEPAAVPPAAPAPYSPVPPAPAGWTRRDTGYVVGGVGVAALATSAYLFTRARAAEGRVESDCLGGCVWNDDIAAHERAGQRLDTAGLWVGAAGAVAVTTGIVLAFVLDTGPTDVALSPLPGRGAGISWARDF